MCCLRRDRGEGYHATTFEDVIARGVHDAVRHQAESRVDVMSDGEMSKISYATYIRRRITGFESGRCCARPRRIWTSTRNSATNWSRWERHQYLRPICKARSRLRRARHCAHEGCSLEVQCSGRFLKRGVTRIDRGIPAQRILRVTCGVPGSAGRSDPSMR